MLSRIFLWYAGDFETRGGSPAYAAQYAHIIAATRASEREDEDDDEESEEVVRGDVSRVFRDRGEVDFGVDLVSGGARASSK